MKRGDKIYLAINDRITTCEIIEFYSFFTYLKAGDKNIIAPKFHEGLFYGYSYEKGRRYLFIKKLWYYPFAIGCEKIRYIIKSLQI